MGFVRKKRALISLCPPLGRIYLQFWEVCPQPSPSKWKAAKNLPKCWPFHRYLGAPESAKSHTSFPGVPKFTHSQPKIRFCGAHKLAEGGIFSPKRPNGFQKPDEAISRQVQKPLILDIHPRPPAGEISHTFPLPTHLPQPPNFDILRSTSYDLVSNSTAKIGPPEAKSNRPKATKRPKEAVDWIWLTVKIQLSPR